MPGQVRPNVKLNSDTSEDPASCWTEEVNVIVYNYVPREDPAYENVQKRK